MRRISLIQKDVEKTPILNMKKKSLELDFYEVFLKNSNKVKKQGQLANKILPSLLVFGFYETSCFYRQRKRF